jgi:hypothetical protein
MTRSYLFAAAVFGDGTLSEFLQTLPGPEFLAVYLVWFGLTFGTVLALRAKGYDNALTTLGGLALFLGLGVVRIAVGSAHGLESWNYLILMMALGTVCFFARARKVSSGDSSSGSGWSSCSTGGGCGGAGCGGGGCGGCGGG